MQENILNLIVKLVEGLIFDNRIPDRNSLDEKVLEEVIQKLDISILTPSILREAIGDFAFEEVLQNVKSGDGVKRRLSEMKSVDARVISKKILELVLKLPLEYKFFFRLPKSQIKFKSVEIQDDIEVFCIDEKNIKDLPEAADSKGFRDLFTNGNKFSVGDTVLVIKRRGYVGNYGRIKIFPNEDPLYIMKVILGIYLALEVVKRGEDTNYIFPFSAYSYDIYEPTEKFRRTINESTEDAELVLRLQFDESKLSVSDLNKVLKISKTDFDYSNEILGNLFKKTFPDKVIKKQLMVKNAAYWLYEAFKTNQEHVKAVYLTTAFDSLVNAKGKEDNKEYKAALISNIIADHVLEADIITERLRNLYSLRNEIVHGEKAISSLDRYSDEIEKDQRIIYDGLWYLIRFLSNRIHFVSKGLTVAS